MTEVWALFGAVVGTYLWRALGVGLSGRINTNSEFFKWIACVTYAMVAGLVFRIMTLPVGLLAELPTSARLIAAGLGFAVMLWRHPRLGGLIPGLLAGSSVILIAGLLQST